MTAAGIALGAAALAVAAFFAGRAVWKEPPPAPLKFQRLTFRRGFVFSARFSSDGQAIVYSAQWDSDPTRLFETRVEGTASRRLDLPDAILASVSSRGDLAIFMRRPTILWWEISGTLATVPIGGGAVPRELATDVQWADWAPDGNAMLRVRNDHLEFPAGKVISQKGAGFPRFSPRGDLIAFSRGGAIHVVDTSGKERFVSREFIPVVRFAWAPKGDEIWVSEPFAPSGVIHAVTLSGKERIALRAPTGLSVLDISRDGRVLVSAGIQRWETWSRPDGMANERDLAVLGTSDAMGISPDGTTSLVNEGGSFYLRKTDGSPPKRLGEGYGSSLSADGNWVAVVRPGSPSHLVLVPTGAGQEKILESGGMEWHERDGIYWSSDGRRLAFSGHEQGHQDRMYTQDVAGGKPRPLTPEGVPTQTCSISPDGRFLIVEQHDGFWMYPVDGGEKRLVEGMLRTDYIWRNWSPDGRFVYAWNPLELPFRVFRVELATGRREPWKTIAPQDPAGIWSADLLLSPDGQSYTYNCHRSLTDLYLVDGLK